MLSKPWFQLLLAVLVVNALQALIIVIGTVSGSEVATLLMLAASCAIFTAVITTPDTATTGHKMLVLTFLAATVYFAIFAASAAWALADVMAAWYIYDYLQNTYATAMQVFTGFEILAIFGNAGARMGRVGELFGRGIDYIYSAVFLRRVGMLRGKRV